jgi:uncharacterized protein
VRVASHPALYDPLATDPLLHGVQCTHCGRVYFPPIGIGCEVCGATEQQLAPKPLAADGVVFAVAEVHLAPAPFTVADIALDDGPLIRGIIHPDSSRAQIGDRVSARWNIVRHDEDGSEVVEPGFVAMTSGTEATA